MPKMQKWLDEIRLTHMWLEPKWLERVVNPSCASRLLDGVPVKGSNVRHHGPPETDRLVGDMKL